jgi:hypothetical protein
MKENEMSAACSMHGFVSKAYKNFGKKTLKEETTWKVLQ